MAKPYALASFVFALACGSVDPNGLGEGATFDPALSPATDPGAGGAPMASTGGAIGALRGAPEGGGAESGGAVGTGGLPAAGGAPNQATGGSGTGGSLGTGGLPDAAGGAAPSAGGSPASSCLVAPTCAASEKVCGCQCVAVANPRYGCTPDACDPCPTPPGTHVYVCSSDGVHPGLMCSLF
jgi:hypothetical protein